MKVEKSTPTIKTNLTRGFVVLLGIAILFSLSPMLFAADSYPNRPIRFIITGPPGGTTDILGRIIGPKLAERLGQPLVTENRPGAGGNVAYEVAAKSKPDGYTMVLAFGSLATSPSLYKKLNYHPIKDFAPISMVAEMPYMLIIRSSLPVNSLKELVAYAKTEPGKLNYGSSGLGSPAQLAMELLKSLAKINIVHVPYKDANQMLIGLMGGENDMVVIGPGVSMPAIQAGKVRALAVMSEHRLPSLPNVPTVREAGIDNCEVTGWYGVVATAGTPRDIIDRLNAEWIKIVAVPNTKEQIQKAGFEPLSSTPEQFAEFIKTETVRWGKVIKDANISAQD